METRPYRRNVGAILQREDGLVLMAERVDQPGAWQLPQGGVDGDEPLVDALWRELGEELGLRDPRGTCELLGQGPEVCYDFPEGMTSKIARRYAGQAQTLFLLRFRGVDADMDLSADAHPEFRAIRWVEVEEMVSMTWPIKRAVVEATVEALRSQLGAWRGP